MPYVLQEVVNAVFRGGPLLAAALLCGGFMLAQAAPPKPKAAPAKATAAPAAPAAPAGNAALGRDKAEAERCIECHGERGQGQDHANGPEGKFAKLAGQSAPYLFKQLEDFRSGARKHDVMAVMARSVDDADLHDILAWFAAQPAMQGDGAANDVGQRLYAEGDASRGIAACIGCHGDAQRAPATPLHPRIAGQEYRYLTQQLHDWRSGWRRNSPGGVMGPITAQLTDAELDALALYLAGLR